MEAIFVLIVAGLTSAGAYVLGATRLGFSKVGLRSALGKACECVGLTLVFSALNLAIAMIAILTIRSLSGRFFSLYIASDMTFLMLSLLQALTFQAWREGSRQRHTAESHDCEPRHRQP